MKNSLQETFYSEMLTALNKLPVGTKKIPPTLVQEAHRRALKKTGLERLHDAMMGGESNANESV
jgi:hypothetical protein